MSLNAGARNIADAQIYRSTHSRAKYSAETAVRITEERSLLPGSYGYAEPLTRTAKKECATKQIPDETLRTVTAKVIGSTEFDAELFEELIEKIIVPQSNRLQYVFRDGHTVEREW